MKLKSLMDKSAREWSAMSGTELRRAYQQVKHAMKERAKTFAKHGQEGRVLPSSKGLSESEMRTKLKSASAYLRGRRSTYGGLKQSESEQLRRMQEAMPDMGFKTPDDLRQFGDFMNEMDDRFGNIKYDSMDAKKLYKEAQRLNVETKSATPLRST